MSKFVKFFISWKKYLQLLTKSKCKLFAVKQHIQLRTHLNSLCCFTAICWTLSICLLCFIIGFIVEFCGYIIIKSAVYNMNPYMSTAVMISGCKTNLKWCDLHCKKKCLDKSKWLKQNILCYFKYFWYAKYKNLPMEQVFLQLT